MIAKGRVGRTARGDGWRPPAGDRWVVVLLLALSAASLVFFFEWLWHRDVSAEQRWLGLVVSCGFLALPVFHLFMAGYLALRFRLGEVPSAASSPERRTVDVFLTVVDEPLEMVEENLRAALQIRYPHETYLLDDGGNPAFAALASRLGARYIARDGNEEFKAGNVNHALDHSGGELIAIFDADHRPDPSFLDRTVGFFDDPEIGFVQVMVTASNSDESLFAEAAAQTAFDADLNGALYVLDMGEPVSILRLARQLLRLRGRDPDVPGAISVVGLRPGEKRHENLVYAFERREPTAIDGVWSITGPALDTTAVTSELTSLLDATNTGDSHAVSEALGALCALRPATAAD